MKRKIFHKDGKIKYQDLHKHETKLRVLLKFSLVLLIFVGYFIFIAQKYGIEQGFLVAALSWSFFVLCTPIADAGFLIDFPLRLITGIRMFLSEIIVWGLAISLNFYAFFYNPEIYSRTKILILFEHILNNPFPFWSIILISAVGTFFSIRFGDELLDKVKHKERVLHQKHKHNYNLIVMIFIFVFAIILYDFLLKQLGINLPI